MTIRYNYNSLEDYLISNPLNVDGVLDDGWGAPFPVKGRELDASILFADISDFSERTLDLTPIETLIFANNFFSWITAEALRNKKGIIDKYIGDEIMIVFSKEFGSEDHFIDALQTARWMSENDWLAFYPHMGIDSGKVVIGYVGTPLKYNCSVFGLPVALAARCANIKPLGELSSSIIFPADLWKINYELNNIFPPMKYQDPLEKDKINEKPQAWQIFPKRIEKIKNMPDIEVLEIANQSIHYPSQSAQERAKDSLKTLKEMGLYRRYANQQF